MIDRDNLSESVLYNRSVVNPDGNWPTSPSVYVKLFIVKDLLRKANLRRHRYLGHSTELQMESIPNVIDLSEAKQGALSSPCLVEMGCVRSRISLPTAPDGSDS